MGDLFRCAGDIIFDSTSPTPGHICDVQLKQFSETSNFLQYLQPLTPEHPYFFAQIRALAHSSKITLGIAGPDIAEDAHPGNWNNSVGYHSNTGECYSSHLNIANTTGQKFGIGDVFGVLVTYFGEKMSTVMFLKNGTPVATRFLFEQNKEWFLPTISLQCGPIDLGLMWPEAAVGVPSYSEKNMLHWIRPACVEYEMMRNMFQFKSGSKLDQEIIVQSPSPLSSAIQHYEVIVQETSPNGRGPAIALASCSPVRPSPTCLLDQDYIRWFPDGEKVKVRIGQRMGWGVQYNPSTRNDPDFDPQSQQLVLCYVTLDTVIVYCRMMLQPVGGFYPLLILHSSATKATVDVESNPKPAVNDKLDTFFVQKLSEALAVQEGDLLSRSVDTTMLRCSEALEVEVTERHCQVRVPPDTMGIHVIQFSMTMKENDYVFLEIINLHEDSIVCLGVASEEFPLNKCPGKQPRSVGWHSRDGRLYTNEKTHGNMKGERFKEGDIVGVEIEAFAEEMSVALFNRNYHPVGTRYYSQSDRSQFLPTIALCGNGQEVMVNVVWQCQNAFPPSFGVTNPAQWCLPVGSRVDPVNNIVYVKEHSEALAMQAPYSLHRTYNHFEIQIIDDFDEIPPPAIALSTASPLDPPPQSNFKQDFLRFWPVGEASSSVKGGDLVGWGVLYVDSKHHDQEQLVICYLTINRKVALSRVIFQPPGGFYPLVLLPGGLNRVKLEFGATIIREHPFTQDTIDKLLREARERIHFEQEQLAEGKDMDEIFTDNLFSTLGLTEDSSGNNHSRRTTGEGEPHDGRTNSQVPLQMPTKSDRKLSKVSMKPADTAKSKSCVLL